MEPGNTPQHTAAPAKARPSRSKRLGFGIVTALLILLTVEGSIRIIKTLGDDVRARHQKWYVMSPTQGWVPCPNFEGKIYGLPRKFDARGLLAVDGAKLRNTAKPNVVVIGDSNAFGFQLKTPETYSEQLNALLPEVNVINRGLIGYTSYQGLKQLEQEALNLRPAVLVISFNYNDRRYVVTPDQADGAEYFGSIARQTRIHQLNRDIYMLRAVGALTGQEGLFDPEEDWDLEGYRVAQTHVSIEKMPARVSPEHYRENLMKMAQFANAHGIPVIFLTMRDSPLMTQALTESEQLARAGKAEEAIARLKASITQNNGYRLLAYRVLARLMRQQGRMQEIEKFGYLDYPAYSLHGGNPVELDTDYNQIMREVAQATGATVVDVGAVTIQKPEVYIDYCHLDPEGHKLIAQMLVQPVRQALAKKGNGKER